ncbi:MAG: BatA domain-containing protein, partial [Deltaproteobacteria bacterium]|nr:BatA domain-containing protein [Deltaproteobacteria bacterium]
MSFLAPFMLIALVAVAAPIWIHLFGAKRARRVDFAAVDFLLGTDRKVSRSLRLRELLLLIARIALFLVVPLLVAKPFASCSASGPSVERGPQGAILIIDNGFASRYRIGDETLLDRARIQARRILDELGPEADVQVLFTVDDDSPDGLSRDHLRLRDRIADARASAEGGNAIDALA